MIQPSIIGAVESHRPRSCRGVDQMAPSAVGIGPSGMGSGFSTNPMRAVEIGDQFDRVHLAHLERDCVLRRRHRRRPAEVGEFIDVHLQSA